MQNEKRLHPTLTTDQIQSKFFSVLYKKEDYKDRYFDIMYKKLSKSLKF